MHWKQRITERHDAKGPVAVVGDVHGAIDLLDRLLEKLGDIPLLHVGDLVDRGPDPMTVVQRMIDVGARGVRGNHEEWITQWAMGEGFDDMALFIGGVETLASYGIDARVDLDELASSCELVPDAHKVYLSSLPCVLDLRVDDQRYWLIHAGLPATPRITRDDELPAFAERHRTSLLWSKTEPHDMSRVESTVISGHVPDVEPFDFGHVIRLDTGAGRYADTGVLTAVILPERRFITA